MRRIPGMLIVGAADRNAGKTELACRLIAETASKRPVVAVKVTAIDESGGRCPRGGEGCGVCSSLKGSWRLIRETDADSDKDTCRMLAAGAERVYWLCALKTRLDDALDAFLEQIGSGALCISESNSLRLAAEPDVFLMVRSPYGRRKASATAVWEHADRIVTLNDDGFDLDLRDVSVVDGQWALRAEASALIMAGGFSARMGADKTMLDIKGEPLVKRVSRRLAPHFREMLISANDADKFAFLKLPVVPDRQTSQGPLMGIASALAASRYDVNMVIACDIPDFDPCFIRKMLRSVAGFDAVLPVDGSGRPEPLFAVYRKKLVPVIQRALTAGTRRIIEALDGCNVKFLAYESPVPLVNLNTKQDYEEYISG